jgi:predicted permease
VSGEFFPALGVSPALGRLLTPDDDRTPGADKVVVLSHAYWSTRFGGRTDIVDDVMLVNGEQMTIVGVAPEGFTGATVMQRPQVFVPLSMAVRMRPGWTGMERRDDHWLYLFARLRPGMTREQAERSMSGPFGALIRDVEFPELRTRMSARAGEQFLIRRIVLEDGSRGRNRNQRQTRTVLSLLMTVTGLVLLIACANVANLLLSRAADRAPEMAVRSSMGASRMQLIRLLLVEATLVGVAGATVALLVVRGTANALLTLMPARDGATLFENSPSVLVFTMALGLATGLLVGLAPALHGAGTSLATGINVLSARVSASRRASRFRTSLATAQIALATALLAVAGLFITSLTNVAREELGLKTDGLATFRLAPGLNGYTSERVHGVFEQVEASMRGVPGVISVTASTTPLLNGDASAGNVTVEGYEPGPDGDSDAFYTRVGTDFLRTIGVPLLAGREFAASDVADAPKVAIVNEAFARKFKLGSNPAGQRMRYGAGGPLDIEIVGLAQDAKYRSVKGAAPPQFYLPYRQPLRRPVTALTFYVRSTGDPQSLVTMIPGVIRRIDPNLPVNNLRTMDDQIWGNVTTDRVLAVLSSSFAGLATLLAAIGLYAVLAYTVTQRFKEIGIRMALGARAFDVGHMIFAHVGRLALVGGVIGIAVALGLGRLAEALLFEVDGTDPAILAIAAAAITTVVLAAAAVPTRRATRVDPVVALRAE